MNLFKLFTKNECPNVGLMSFREKRKIYQAPQKVYVTSKKVFKPDYSNNFFLL